jgi:hypothetical protein
VEVTGPAEEYLERLHAVLGAALDRAVPERDLDYLDDPEAVDIDLTVRQVPDWFAAVRAGRCRALRRGWPRRRLAPERLARTLRPGQPVTGLGVVGRHPKRRGTGEHLGRPHGESGFACDELRWAACTAGAARVSGPEAGDAEQWQAEAR